MKKTTEWIRMVTVCALVGFWGHTAEVALIRQIVTTPSKWENQKTVDRFLKNVQSGLRAVEIDTRVLASKEIRTGTLSPYKLVFFPYNSHPSEELVAATEAYVEQGGKVVFFYMSNERLLRLVGVEKARYHGGKKMPALAAMQFDATLVEGAPQSVAQASWNIAEPVPRQKEGAKLFGRWVGREGADPNLVAVTVHPNGMAFSHVYLKQDPAAGERLMLAVCGRYVEGLWPRAVRSRLNRVGVFRNYPGLSALEDALRDSKQSSAVLAVRKARALVDKAEAQVTAKHWSEAFDTSGQAVAAAEQAFLLSRSSRSGELRGAWIHSAYGVRGWDWDRSVKVLSENGFNALFVNMCWGAVADYKSDVLPVHPDVKEKGDQIELCLKACRKYGVELHVWRVNWNMGGRTPKEIRDKMRAEGRTQVTIKGADSRFLAPHVDENFRLERDSMLEIVRKYRVDGIHFDYIRYPNADCDFSDSARKAFEKWLGKPVKNWPESCRKGPLREKYNRWRRGNITRLVKAVYEGAHRIRGDIQVSAAVFGNWDTSPHSIAQATEEWMDNGWLDFVCPMNYTPNNAYLERLLSRQLTSVGARIPLYCGIGTWRHDSAARSAEQIDMIRELGGDGFVCFALNERFAMTKLPKLSLGSTSEGAGMMPHHSPSAQFTVSPGDPELGGGYGVLRDIEFEARFPKPVAFIDPEVLVERDGVVVQSGRRVGVTTKGALARVELLPKEPGRYRIVLRGTWRRKGRRKKQQLLVRSPVVDVLSPERVTEIRRRLGPPKFAGNGKPKIAIWADGAYGSEPLVSALYKRDDIDVAELFNLDPKSLQACDAILLCQPRSRTALFRDPDTMKAVVDYMRKGGGVMTMHALVGIRDYVCLAPMVATGADSVPSSEWKISSSRHTITKGLSRAVQTSTFVDMVGLKPGKSGRVLAVAADDQPVVVAGKRGRGRYVACGLGVAIGKNDQDISPSESELALVVNAVRWLAGAK
ncbi:MAG: family 10 glycosylhydrolase [Lentisphaeria bacterium]|nr:family 10 glycosylhydrolase [Lentisphaeria bacterium]